MNLDLVGKLLDAGFTKDEIFQLARTAPAAAAPDSEGSALNGSQVETGNQDHAGAPEQSENTDVGNAAEESGSEKQPPVDKGSDFENRLAGIEKTMADLTKAIQAGNLRNDSFANPVESLEERTDQAMEQLIRPVRRERAM